MVSVCVKSSFNCQRRHTCGAVILRPGTKLYYPDAVYLRGLQNSNGGVATIRDLLLKEVGLTYRDEIGTTPVE